MAPSGSGCPECEAAGGWWFHLRRYASAGISAAATAHQSQHASAHAVATGHPVVSSFEPGEAWVWNFRRRVLRRWASGSAAPVDIHSTSRFPAQPAAYLLTGRRTCTDHRADRLLMSVVKEDGRARDTRATATGEVLAGVRRRLECAVADAAPRAAQATAGHGGGGDPGRVPHMGPAVCFVAPTVRTRPGSRRRTGIEPA